MAPTQARYMAHGTWRGRGPKKRGEGRGERGGVVVSMCRRCIVMRWTCRLFCVRPRLGWWRREGRQRAAVHLFKIPSDVWMVVLSVSSHPNSERGRWSGACFGSTPFVSRWESWKGGNRPRRGTRFVFRGPSLSWYQGWVLTGTWLAQLDGDEAETPLFQGIEES